MEVLRVFHYMPHIMKHGDIFCNLQMASSLYSLKGWATSYRGDGTGATDFALTRSGAVVFLIFSSFISFFPHNMIRLM